MLPSQAIPAGTAVGGFSGPDGVTASIADETAVFVGSQFLRVVASGAVWAPQNQDGIGHGEAPPISPSTRNYTRLIPHLRRFVLARFCTHGRDPASGVIDLANDSSSSRPDRINPLKYSLGFLNGVGDSNVQRGTRPRIEAGELSSGEDRGKTIASTRFLPSSIWGSLVYSPFVRL